MTKAYDVKMAGKTIGHVNVWPDGLYLHFSCRCNFSGEVMYQLVLRSQDREENLGLLVPMDSRFGLEKKLPKKQIGQGSLGFFLKPRHEKGENRFVPIRAEEPFAYLRQLEQAVLAVRSGQIGIVLPSEK